MSATLQIVTINDVYEIDHLPAFCTCLRECKENGAHRTISTLPGDFVAPSLLSSLDKGSSMITCLNQAGLDYACIGNHESDVPIHHLHNRIRESTFKWINSNMEDFPLPDDIKLPKYEIVEVQGEAGHVRRVALIGLCGEDRSVMKPGAFGDCFIEPVLDAGARWYKYLIEKEKVDTVIPLTHQLIGFDRLMAQQQIGYPVIVGGHDHQPYNEAYGNCKVLKVGMDGTRIGIINITWADASTDRPTVTIGERNATDFVKDPVVQKTVQECKQILVEIEQSILCTIPPSITLSSVGMRLGTTTVGTFICSTLKKALSCELCMCGSGSIRASKNYMGRSTFTYADLKAEMPFNTLISVIDLPGQLCKNMIEHTRSFALLDPPVAKGGFIQTDDRCTWDRDTNQVLEINGAPIILDKMYRVCLNHGMLDGLDDVTPLIKWKAAAPATDLNAHKDAEAAVDAKECIVSYFSRSLIFDILHSSAGKIKKMDADGNGVITKAELKAYLAAGTSGTSVTNMLVDNLFATMDVDNNGETSIEEINALASAHLVEMAFAKIHEKDMLSVVECVASLVRLSVEQGGIESAALAEMKENLKKAAVLIDTDGDGFISRAEYDKYLAEHHARLRDSTKKIKI